MGGSVGCVGGSVGCVGGFVGCVGGSVGCVGGSVGCVGGFVGCVGGSVGCVGGFVGCVGGSVGCVGGSVGCVGGSVGCVGGSVGFSSTGNLSISFATYRCTSKTSATATLPSPFTSPATKASPVRTSIDAMCFCISSASLVETIPSPFTSPYLSTVMLSAAALSSVSTANAPKHVMLNKMENTTSSATHFLACSFICSILSFQKVLSPAAVWQMYCGFTAILFHRYIPFAAVRSKMLQIAIIILFFPMNCKPIL